MNTMIKLKNIHRDDVSGNIRAVGYIEDCEKAVELEMNRNGEWVNEPVLPEGYEYCGGHIFHAKNYLKGLIKKPFSLHDKMIMWC